MNNFNKFRYDLSNFYHEKYLETGSDFYKDKINSVGMNHLNRKLTSMNELNNFKRRGF